MGDARFPHLSGALLSSTLWSPATASSCKSPDLFPHRRGEDRLPHRSGAVLNCRLSTTSSTSSLCTLSRLPHRSGALLPHRRGDARAYRSADANNVLPPDAWFSSGFALAPDKARARKTRPVTDKRICLLLLVLWCKRHCSIICLGSCREGLPIKAVFSSHAKQNTISATAA